MPVSARLVFVVSQYKVRHQTCNCREKAFFLEKMDNDEVIRKHNEVTICGYAKISGKGARDSHILASIPNAIILCIRKTSVIIYLPLSKAQAKCLREQLDPGIVLTLYSTCSMARIDHRGISADVAVTNMCKHENILSFTCQFEGNRRSTSLICYLGKKRSLEHLGKVIPISSLADERIKESNGVAITNQQYFNLPHIRAQFSCSPDQFPVMCQAFSFSRYISVQYCCEDRVDFTVVTYR